MKAVRYEGHGGPEVLGVVEVETPQPGPGEIRITVTAAGVNPVDWKIREGHLGPNVPSSFPAGVGVDAAGVVSAIGADVGGVSIGDIVFGSGQDCYAEEAILSAWAAVPEGVPTQQTAGWGGVITTAVRVLDQIDAQPGQRLFISGGSGGVGTALVQIAVARGLTVIASASPPNQDYLRSLGATPVEYGDALIGRVRALGADGVDLAVDVSGAGVIGELVELTGDASKVISIADFSAPERGAQVLTAGGDAVAAFEEAIAIPGFRVPIDRHFTIKEAAAAHEAVATGHTVGKIVILP